MTRVVFSLAIILGTAALCLRVGPVSLGFGSIAHAMFHYTASNSDVILIWLRLPRIVLGVLVGASLAVSGALLQALTNNPLADPVILGINGGAALALLSLMTFFPAAPGWTQSAAALGGAALATALVFAITQGVLRGQSESTFLVVGATVSGVFASAATALIVLAGQDLQRLQFWLVGSLAARDWRTVFLALPLILLGIGMALPLGRRLNALSLGSEAAQTLGFDANRTRAWVLCAALLLSAGSVAAAGPIGFVGLIVPHLLRPVLGNNYRRLLGASAVTGAVFLPLCDLAARSALVPYYGELPVGLLTAVFGAPALLIVLRRRVVRG